MPGRLLLIPTEFERRRLPADFPSRLPSDLRIETVGFGPIASAVRAVQLVEALTPERVLLLGIAGAYGAGLPVGAAFQFSEVACDGIGVGDGDNFRSAESLGWPQWPGLEAAAISLDVFKPGPALGGRLITCCAASGTPDEANRRAARHLDAAAEDMEGFAVAMACRLADVPCSVVRGVSNVAGVRDKENWRIDDALAAAAAAVFEILNNE